MGNNTLTARQSFFLMSLFLTGNLVTANGAKGTPTGWLAFLVLMVVSVPLFLLFLSVSDRQNPGEVFVKPFGKIIGGIITAAYCVIAVLLAGDALRTFADFIVINDLNDAGVWGNSALMAVIALYLLICTPGTLGRAAWIIQPMTALLFLVSFALTIPHASISNLFPLFAEGKGMIAQRTLNSFEALVQAVFPILILGNKVKEKWHHSAIFSGVFMSLLFAVMTARDTAVLGFPTVALFRFPTYVAANAQRHGEVLISVIFVLCQPFRTSICLRYAQECLTEWMPSWKRAYPFLLILLATLACALSWKSAEIRYRGVRDAVIAGVLLISAIGAFFAKRKKRGT